MKRLLLATLLVSSPSLAQAADPPPGLTTYLSGNAADVKVKAKGPAMILMGGGAEVDAAFRWWKPRLNGGDVVVLRASGSDGYNRYLHETIGGCDSVETLLVTSRALADSDYVAERVARAEGIWIAGGDQWRYLKAWRGSKLAASLNAAWKRGAIVGGTSAGCAVLGGLVFTAERGGVGSRSALRDPFAHKGSLALTPFPFAPLKGVLTDSHFSSRERLGRLAAFLAVTQTSSWTSPRKQAKRGAGTLGLGVDERTALLIDAKGEARVLGKGSVSLVRITRGGARAGAPLAAEVSVTRLRSGDTLNLPAGDGHKRKAVVYLAQEGELKPR